jgi:hypothetical protein
MAQSMQGMCDYRGVNVSFQRKKQNSPLKATKHNRGEKNRSFILNIAKMKKNLLIVCCATIIACLYSCNKDSIESPVQLDAELSALMLDINVEELLLSSVDHDLNTFNAELLDRVVYFSVKLRERRLLNEDFFSMFKGKKSLEFASLFKEYQSKKSTNQKVVLNGIEYGVGMNFYNMGACDLDKEVIICIGSEIIDPDPVFEDKIAGYVLAKDGSKVAILVSEEFAKSTDHPLFIITNGVDEKESNQKPENILIASLKSTSTYNMYELKLDEEQINYRYERSGDSEYNVSWFIIYYGESGGFVPFMPHTWEHIKDIKKTQIGDPLDYEIKFYYWDFVAGTVNQWMYDDRILFVGVTYEHDWYASLKTINIPSGHDFDVIIEFRATGSNEYYQPFCFDIGPGGSYGWLNFDQTVYSKGYAKFESIQRVYN